MKKKPSVFFIGIIIIIGGYFLMNEYQKMQMVKEAQQKTEIFIHSNYEDIDEVYINKKNYKFDPMSELYIGGHINGDKSLFFNIMFNTQNNKVGDVTSVFSSKDFPPEKEECKDNFCQ